jgi:hypothetical protein
MPKKFGQNAKTFDSGKVGTEKGKRNASYIFAKNCGFFEKNGGNLCSFTQK